jgi:hypothetical protein
VYEGATPIGVVLDALLAQTKEPAVAPGSPAHVYFGNKVFRSLQKADVAGLEIDIDYLANTDVQFLARIIALEGKVGTITTLRTFEFNGKTYSYDPISVMALPGYREDGAMGGFVKANWIVTEPNESNPYFDIAVPGDGSWVDAFRIKQAVYDGGPVGFNTGYSPVGLLHNMQSVFIAPYEDILGSISESLDFRFSLLAYNYFSEGGYSQIGASIVGRFQGSYREIGGGAPRVLVHSIRGIGAQIPVPGIQTKVKVEVRLKSPGAPLVIACNGGVTAQLHGQLYPEVL